MGFVQSSIDECVFYREPTIFLCYVDDGIFAGHLKDEIDGIIEELQGIEFNMEDRGNTEDYLGMTLTKQDDGSIKIWQPQSIKSIIDKVPIMPHLKDKATPLATSKPVLGDVDAPKFNQRFHYRQVI
eukprot:4724854-Ditylum_brightwellii.AAC.1